MANDNTLWLTGTADDPTETVAATANGAAKDWGASRLFWVELAVGGAVTGTNPTLDVKVQDSADQVTWVDRGTFPQVTATQQGYQTTGNVARPEVPRSASSVAPLRIAVYTQNRYVRCVETIGGTATPTFRGVSVVGIPRLARG